MTPMAKMDRRDSAPPENMFTTPKMVFGLVLEEPRHCGRVDARHRNERADAVDHQRADQEHQARANLAETGRIAESRLRDCIAAESVATVVCLPCFAATSTEPSILPPAASMAARAPLVAPMPLSVHGLLQLARQHDLRLLGEHRHHAGLLQRLEVDHRRIDAVGELGQAHFGARGLDLRAEAHLRQATLQRHLAAFEADLVVAALARALTLDATAAGLALAGGGAATDAQARLLAARGRLDGVELHGHFASSTFSRWIAGVDHAAVLRGVDHDHRVVAAAQAQAASRTTMMLLELAEGALQLRDA